MTLYGKLEHTSGAKSMKCRAARQYRHAQRCSGQLAGGYREAIFSGGLTMKHAIGYLRVSTSEQTSERVRYHAKPFGPLRAA